MDVRCVWRPSTCDRGPDGAVPRAPDRPRQAGRSASLRVRPMIRNYLILWLRNLIANKIYGAINIIGLAAGFAAAVLIALFVRDEFSYDTWIPGHERTYLITQTIKNPGHTPTEYYTTPSDFADSLRQGFPSIEAATSLSIGFDASLRHGAIEENETVHWADPNFFDLLPLPVIAGDL